MARPHNSKQIVYRYVDMTVGVVKYVGITSADRLNSRILEHQFRDKWYHDGHWKIEYFECDNQSEAEAFEAHLIALYGTGRYYNRQKVGWGINKYLPDVENRWKTSIKTPFEDELTEAAVKLFRALLRDGHREAAAAILYCFDMEGVNNGANGQTNS